MKIKDLAIVIIVLAIVSGCRKNPAEPVAVKSTIVAYMHWDQGEAGKKVALVETRDTTVTDANGFATFRVLPGHYTVRAFGINRGGPSNLTLDFPADARADDTTKVDIVDCLPCV